MLSLLAFLFLWQASSPRTAREQLKTALDQGRFSEAEQLIQSELKSHQKDPALWFYLGVSCNGLDQVDDAIAAFEKARQLAPNQPDIDFNLGLLYWRNGDLANAVSSYKTGLASDSTNKGALQNYALLLMKMGENERAIASLLTLKKVDPLALPTRVSLIECYLKTKNRDAAIAETNELLSAHLADPEEQTKLAAIVIDDDDSDLAKTILESSLRVSPAQPKAYAALGLVYLKLKRFREAADSFESAVHLEPNSSEFAMAFANSLVLWNRPNTLLAFLKSVQTQFGGLAEFQHKLAFAYYGVGEFSNAIDVLEKLLRTNPQRQDQIYFLLARSYFGIGKLADSESAFKKAIELNPKEPLYYESYGTLLRKEGQNRNEDALAILKQAVQLAPQDPALLLQLGLCYESKDDWNDAVVPLQAAVRGNPDSLPARVALATVYFRLGRKGEAELQKRKIAELESKLQYLQSDTSGSRN